MTPRPMSRFLRLSERLYGILINLYPVGYCREYGWQMRQTFGDMCREAYHDGGAAALLDWWLTTLLDLLKTVIEEHRKAGLSVSKERFIQWSGWLLLFGGIFFAGSSISQLQPGSHYTFDGIYQLAIFALFPAIVLVALGLAAVYMRYETQMRLFGKLSLLVAIAGVAAASISGLLSILSVDAGRLAAFGFIVHLIGVSVFGGYVFTVKLLPKWNFSILIGSAMPLTIVLLLSQQSEIFGANWGAFAMLVLISVSWILTGLALNSPRVSALQHAAAS